jgi:hypothetical protein
VAAIWPDVEALPVHDDAHGASFQHASEAFR